MSRLLAWARAHRPQAALGAGAVGAVGIGLWRRRRNQAAGATTTSGVPVDATTAASVVPASSDTAGGIGYDSTAFDYSASSYLPQISEELSTLNATVAGIAHTGGVMTLPASAPKPAKKKLSAHQEHELHQQHIAHLAAVKKKRRRR